MIRIFSLFCSCILTVLKNCSRFFEIEFGKMSNVTMASAYLPYISGEIVDNSSAQAAIVKVNIAFIALILITAGMRFWVRLRMLRSSGLDDSEAL
jgi:hypothetical protein